jgi:hypothetical protein
MDTPVTLHLPTLLKVLTYDRNLRAPGATELVIGVAYQSRNHLSADARDEFLSWLSASGASFFPGLTVRRVPVDLDSESDLASVIRTTGIRVLYIAPLRAYDVNALTAIARSSRVITMTGVSAYLRQGAALAIGVLGDRPRIMINLPASRAAGADYPASLLSLATVTR